jgi:hypothetical protein
MGRAVTRCWRAARAPSRPADWEPVLTAGLFVVGLHSVGYEGIPCLEVVDSNIFEFEL